MASRVHSRMTTTGGFLPNLGYGSASGNLPGNRYGNRSGNQGAPELSPGRALRPVSEP